MVEGGGKGCVCEHVRERVCESEWVREEGVHVCHRVSWVRVPLKAAQLF